MVTRLSLYSFLIFLLLLSIACLSTDNAGSDRGSPGANAFGAGSFSEEESSLEDTEETEEESSLDPTQEYLDTLPLWERQVAMQRIAAENRRKLRLDAKQQMLLWLENAVPDCKDFFGSKDCNPVFIELEPSEICDWKFSRQIKENELTEKGHYFGALAAEKGGLSGGYMWIASYRHQAYQDGAVLNIVQCWNQNQTEAMLTPSE